MKVEKIIVIIIAVLMIFNISHCYAKDIINPDDFEPTTNTYSDSEAVKKAGKIIGVIQGVGSFISLGALIYIGIRYMLCSVEEKAIYKETMLPYIVGAIFTFSGSNIVGIIYNVFA